MVIYSFHEFLKKFYRISNFLTRLGNCFCLFQSNPDTLFLQIKIQREIYYWREGRIQNQTYLFYFVIWFTFCKKIRGRPYFNGLTEILQYQYLCMLKKDDKLFINFFSTYRNCTVSSSLNNKLLFMTFQNWWYGLRNLSKNDNFLPKSEKYH